MVTKKPPKNEDPLYKRKNAEQIFKVRCLFRKNNYLSNPMELQIHMDIEKKVNLSDDLLNLQSIATENLKKYIEGKSKGNQVKLTQVYVTANEKLENEKVENKTIEEIKVLIFEQISEMTSEQQSLHEEIFVKNVKNKLKQSYINYYYELVEGVNQSEEAEL